MKTVAEIMTPAPIVAVVPGRRNDVINTMVRKKLTGLPVIRESDGKLVGVVSRRDIFRNFEEEQLSLIMKKGCIEIEGDKSIIDAARIFAEKRIHRLPVVEDGKLVGIITPTDILKVVRDIKTSKTAEDVISTTCVTVYKDSPLPYAIAAMRISDVAAVPVLDEHGNLVGILTDRDLFSDQMTDEEAVKRLGLADTKLAGLRNVMPLFFTATEDYSPDSSKLVSDYMIKEPLTVFKKTTLNEIARLMILNDFGQLPIRGTKDELVGMIYDVDVLKALLD